MGNQTPGGFGQTTKFSGVTSLQELYQVLGNFVREKQEILGDSGERYTGYQLSELIETAFKAACTWSEQRSNIHLGVFDGDNQKLQAALAEIKEIQRIAATGGLREVAVSVIAKQLRQLNLV